MRGQPPALWEEVARLGMTLEPLLGSTELARGQPPALWEEEVALRVDASDSRFVWLCVGAFNVRTTTS